MKRIIFLIIVLLFVSLSNIFAQQAIAAYDTSGHKVWVRVDTDGRLIISGGGATAANQLGTGSKGYDKITSIGGDSVAAATLGFTSYWKVTVAAVDDTIKFSTSYNYPAIDLRILKPGESYTTTWPLAVANVPKFYFATSGVGTPKAKIFAEGR